MYQTYLAISKHNPNECHSFEWTQDDQLIICGKVVNVDEWEIIWVEQALPLDSDERLNETAVPTNKHVWKNGISVADWPCDIGADKQRQSNGSIENVVEYEGRHYSIVTDWEGNVRWEDEMASETEWNDEEQTGYDHFFNMEEDNDWGYDGEGEAK